MAKKSKKKLGKKIFAWFMLIVMVLSIFAMAITVLFS